MKFKFEESRDNIANSAIETMYGNIDIQDESCVGIFWYDKNSNELFGVESSISSVLPWKYSKHFPKGVKTEPKLHSQKWKKEFFRKKDSRFSGDYTKIPRGRVFEFKDNGFKVFTGSWIDNYPEVKQMIIDEFSLPTENTEFVKDIHWEIGHGWSDEF